MHCCLLPLLVQLQQPVAWLPVQQLQQLRLQLHQLLASLAVNLPAVVVKAEKAGVAEYACVNWRHSHTLNVFDECCA